MFFFKFIKSILKEIKEFISLPLVRLINYNYLKKNDFLVNFKHEGEITLKLPKSSLSQVILGSDIVKKNLVFKERPNIEILLRHIISDLYQQKYIDLNSSVVDIGCSIGDNTLVWAKKLTETAKVFAIDPSIKNIKYGKKLAKLNQIYNVEWVEAVCSDIVGEKLSVINKSKNSIENNSYQPIVTSEYLLSRTIDEIVNNGENDKIGLVHIDVEGFELKVIKGAVNLIKKNKPTITFEQHISKENVNYVFNFLKDLGYRIFMINEVIPGNELDCRNFIAIDSLSKLPSFEKFSEKNISKLDIYRATIGPGLIEF